MVAETHSISLEHGWLFFAAILLRAYSLGGGTYTGLEAVSNNVNMLAEPRVSTGRYTKLYMALSLSFTAGGIILLYLLWEARTVPGQTLNAVVFASIIEIWGIPEPWVREALLIGVLACEAGLLLVAANTGFLGGPAVLANMAADSFLGTPSVPQPLGAAALVVLYSINVFLTFTLSLAGLVKIERLAAAAMDEFPHSVCFAAKLVFEHESWLTRALHNQTVLSVQRLLNLQGRSMVIIPLKL